MTHSAAFTLGEELKAVFERQCAEDCGAEERLRCLKVRIKDEAFGLDGKVAWTTNDKAAAFAECKALLSADEACYLIFRVAEAGPWAFMAFVPDSAPVRDKMLTSSGAATLKRALGGGSVIEEEIHWASLDEVSLSGGSETERRAEEATLMTDTEKLMIAEERLVAIEAAGSKLGSVVGLAFPFVDAATEAVAAFASGTLSLLLLSISEEKIVLRSSEAAASAAQLKASLPPSEPVYALYRWEHGGRGATLFVYFCPEESAVRGKMLHASSKSTVLASLAALGVTPDKSLEGIDAAELSDDVLAAEVFPEAAADGGAAPTMTKAAPKGGRKLNSRNKK